MKKVDRKNPQDWKKNKSIWRKIEVKKDDHKKKVSLRGEVIEPLIDQSKFNEDNFYKERIVFVDEIYSKDG